MENDRGETKTFLVTRKDRKTITIDGNNPLCGREVIFNLEILLVRDASEAEIAAGGKVEAGKARFVTTRQKEPNEKGFVGYETTWEPFR